MLTPSETLGKVAITSFLFGVIFVEKGTVWSYGLLWILFIQVFFYVLNCDAQYRKSHGV